MSEDMKLLLEAYREWCISIVKSTVIALRVMDGLISKGNYDEARQFIGAVLKLFEEEQQFIERRMKP